jgi:hypothetical protein
VRQLSFNFLTNDAGNGMGVKIIQKRGKYFSIQSLTSPCPSLTDMARLFYG